MAAAVDVAAAVAAAPSSGCHAGYSLIGLRRQAAMGRWLLD